MSNAAPSKRTRSHNPTIMQPPGQKRRVNTYLEDPKQIKQLISSLRTVRTHPHTDVGWWCCHTDKMQSLVSFLSDPLTLPEPFWDQFRNQVGTQVSNCQNCAIAYHRSFSEWEISDQFLAQQQAVLRKRLRTIIACDVDRLLPLLRYGALPSSMKDGPEALAMRNHCCNAFLESLLTLRICTEKRYLDLLPAIFLRRTPVDDTEHIAPLLQSIQSLPAGLIPLCFHPKQIVQSWAIRIFKQFSHQYSLPTEQIQFTFRKVFRATHRALTSATPTNLPFENTDPAAVFLAFSSLLPSFPPNVCIELINLHVPKPIHVINMLSSALSHKNGAIVTNASICIEAIVSRVSFHNIFTPESLSIDKLLSIIFTSFSATCRQPRERRSLLKLIAPLLACANNHCTKTIVSTLYWKCFDSLDRIGKDLKDGLPIVIGKTSYDHSPSFELRGYREVLKTTTCLLNWFYAISAPNLPFPDPKRIGQFVTTILQEDPECLSSWDLLRTVLAADIFNLLRCVLPPSDVKLISESFVSKRPKSAPLKAEEKEVLLRIVVPDDKSLVVTFLSGLWGELRQGRHIRSPSKSSPSVIAHEVKVFLDLHRLIGFADIKSIESAMSEDRLKAISWKQTVGMSGDRRRYICDSVSFMQDVIWKRLSSLFTKTGDDWWPELPYHATHLLSSSRKELSGEAMVSLMNMYSMKAATVAGSKGKMVGHFIKSNPTHSHSMAIGFVSSMRVLYAWGSSASIGSFARFFLWYRVLLDLDFSNILAQHGCSEWVVGVLLSFLKSWRTFERDNTEPFNEVCCRFLANMRVVWLTLYSSDDAGYSTNERGQANIKKWIANVTSALLDMHTLSGHMNRAAWVETICKLAPTWGHISEHRKKILSVISLNRKGGEGLTVEQCRALANSIQLNEAEVILGQWEEEERERREARKNLTRSQASLKSKAMSTLSLKKPLRGTRIEDHFAPSKNVPVFSKFTTGMAPPPRMISNPSGAPQKAIRKLAALVSSRPATRGGAQQPMSKMAELRKDHRLAKQEGRDTVPKRPSVPAASHSSSAEPVVPQKTKFELHVEKNRMVADLRRMERAEERKKTEEEERELSLGVGHEDKKKDIQRRGQDKKKGTGSFEVDSGDNRTPENEANSVKGPTDAELKELRKLREIQMLHLPEKRRLMEIRSLDEFQQLLIREKSSFVGSDREFMYSSSRGDTFPDVNSYAKFWEPLLVEEFRASIDNSIKEENAYMRQHGGSSRVEFEVDGTAESIGYQQVLNMTWSGGERPRTKDGAEQYDIFKVRNSDLVLLDIPPLILEQGNVISAPNTTAVGKVLAASFSRGHFNLKISLSFRSLDATPGHGRVIQVSRLSSLIMFQRQIEALWNVGKVPDGLLWPLLEPVEGWRAGQKAAIHIQESGVTELAEPRSFLAKLQRDKILNSSQARAIDSVVLSCLPLYKDRGTTKSPLNDHGGISLIQGPPGTGKTSTVLALLSTLLLANKTNRRTRKAAIHLEGGRVIASLPPVRVLVCAPSNAAVDEIMSRVVNAGLSVPSGGKACPRVVRIGGGTTIDALQSLELRRIAKCDESSPMLDNAVQLAMSKKKEHISEAQAISTKIGEADRQRKVDQNALSAMKGNDGESRQQKLVLEKKIQELTSVLTSLHSKKNATQELINEDRASSKEAEAQKRRESDRAMCNILNRSSIVFATLNSSGHEVMQNFGARFDVIIVDEAAQCCEPDILIPITAGRRTSTPGAGFAHLVLVGDPRQLPATILSNNRVISKCMGRSLFERFTDSSSNVVHMLDTQYRMHPKISRFPSHQFYDKQLQNGECVLEKKMDLCFHDDPQSRFGPLSFIDTSKGLSQEIRSSQGSIHNPDEAKVVVNALVSLMRGWKAFDFREKIVVLSPYREQVALLKRLVMDNPLTRKASVEVSTIDGIQGREKSIVFLSTVRGGNAHNIGFVRDDRRMNVALTRAKHSVIVVGNAVVLSKHSSAWAAFISACKAVEGFNEVSNSQALFPECRNNYVAGEGGRRENHRRRKHDHVASNGHAAVPPTHNRKRLRSKPVAPPQEAGENYKRRRVELQTQCADITDCMDFEPAPNRSNDRLNKMDSMEVDSMPAWVKGERNPNSRAKPEAHPATERPNNERASKVGYEPRDNGNVKRSGKSSVLVASNGLGLRSRRLSQIEGTDGPAQNAMKSSRSATPCQEGSSTRRVPSVLTNPCNTSNDERNGPPSMPAFQPCRPRSEQHENGKKEDRSIAQGIRTNDMPTVVKPQESVINGKKRADPRLVHKNEVAMRGQGRDKAAGHKQGGWGQSLSRRGENHRHEKQAASCNELAAGHGQGAGVSNSFGSGQGKYESVVTGGSMGGGGQGQGQDDFMAGMNVAPWMKDAIQQSGPKHRHDAGRSRTKRQGEQWRNRGDRARDGQEERRGGDGYNRGYPNGGGAQGGGDPYGFGAQSRDTHGNGGGQRDVEMRDIHNGPVRSRGGHEHTEGYGFGGFRGGRGESGERGRDGGHRGKHQHGDERGGRGRDRGDHRGGGHRGGGQRGSGQRGGGQRGGGQRGGGQRGGGGHQGGRGGHSERSGRNGRGGRGPQQPEQRGGRGRHGGNHGGPGRKGGNGGNGGNGGFSLMQTQRNLERTNNLVNNSYRNDPGWQPQ